MRICRIPAVFMRGGTSKALVFKAADLPSDKARWDAIFLGALGSPDPYGRQLDGMGGGLSSLSKVCVVGPASREDADVDYTFAQVAVDEALVDYGGNCGNMSSAIGPFAVEEGMVTEPENGDALVRIHNTNTGKIIHAHFPVEGGELCADGEFELDGVAGTAAPIRLEFLDPGGAKTGKLLPTGNPSDFLDVRGLGAVEATLIDAGNPAVFVAADALGKTGVELPDDLEADREWLTRMESLRCAGAAAMGLPTAASIPKIAMLSAPRPAPTLSGETLDAADMDIAIRMISVGQPHRAVPITGAIGLAIACRVPGTIAHRLCGSPAGPIRVGHASGTTQVDASVTNGRAEYGAVYRTARRLFEGKVLYRAP